MGIVLSPIASSALVP